MIEKYLRKNRWVKIGKQWMDATSRCPYICHRHIAIRVQLQRNKNFCYRIFKII
jgi:hypothetical protein